MIAESRHSPLAYLRAKDIEPDWPALYDAFGEPASMRIYDIAEGEMSVDTVPMSSAPSDWTTEYPVELRFELSTGRGVGCGRVDHVGVRKAFDDVAVVSQSEWRPHPDSGDRVVRMVTVELVVRERFGTADRSATEPIYELGSEEPVGWTAEYSGHTEIPDAERPDQSTAQHGVATYTGTTTWVIPGPDGDRITLTHDDGAWVDERGNRYHIDADGGLDPDD